MDDFEEFENVICDHAGIQIVMINRKVNPNWFEVTGQNDVPYFISKKALFRISDKSIANLVSDLICEELDGVR